MNVLHIYDTPPPGVAADWTMPQDWQQYSDDEHRRWHEMVVQQTKALKGLASESFLKGVRALRLDEGVIPEFSAFNERFQEVTGWEVVAVPGVIPNEPFFRLLAERRFPVANFLRRGGSQDYNDEPDMFHDLFGHLPMFVNPTFGEFMTAYGRAGLRAQKLGTADWLGRLYLHTVEFGLISEGGALRAYGAGLLSSKAEVVHAITNKGVRRLKFNLARLMRTEWPFDTFQPTYFVIESFEALLEEMETTNLRHVYDEVCDLSLLAPGKSDPSDRAYRTIQF